MILVLKILLKALMDLRYLKVTNTASIPFSGPPYAMLFDNHFHLNT